MRPGRNKALVSPGAAGSRAWLFRGKGRVEAGGIGPAQGDRRARVSILRTENVRRLENGGSSRPRSAGSASESLAGASPRLTAARPKPGASRIHPGFRGQKGRTEAGFCPLKAGGVPGQGPGASGSREAAPGLPRDAPGANRTFARPSQGPRRVFAGFSPGGEGGEGAGIGGSARIRTAKPGTPGDTAAQETLASGRCGVRKPGRPG